MKNPNFDITSKKFRAFAAAFIVVIALALIAPYCIRLIMGPDGIVIDRGAIAAYDAEFSSMVGPEHRVSEYRYIHHHASDDRDIGRGPLCVISTCEVIVGETGTVGAVAYGEFSFSDGKWHLHNLPCRDCKETFVVVLDDYIAPPEWQGRSLWAESGMDEEVLGRELEYRFTGWLLFPEYFDFDHFPWGDKYQDNVWYWDGERYVESDYVDTMHLPI